MPTSKNFVWINFREWAGLKYFAWIYFREDRDFEKYFSLNKRKTTFLSNKSFYKSSKYYKYVNNFYMFHRVWSMKASKALRDGAVRRKRNSHCLMAYFFNCLKNAKKQRKRVKIGKIRNHVLFESPHTNFKTR